MNLLKSEYSLLKKYNVSRETILDLYELENLIINKNKEINLISKKTENDIRIRHIVDSAQAIDFIDINDKKCIARFSQHLRSMPNYCPPRITVLALLRHCLPPRITV